MSGDRRDDQITVSSKLQLTDAQINLKCFVSRSTFYVWNGKRVIKFALFCSDKTNRECVSLLLGEVFRIYTVRFLACALAFVAHVLRWNSFAVSH